MSEPAVCLQPLVQALCGLPPAPETAAPVVAYSGGLDSTALLLAAQALWPGRLRALHVHHGLQAAADDFADHALRRCAALGVPLQVLRVQAAHAPGQSPEDAARRARYLALAQAAREQGAPAVWLAHHAQDQAETVLLALSRGAGLPGLAGMPGRFERHGMAFVRPLLGLERAQLRAAVEGLGLDWVEDPSNRDPQRTRNRIRHDLLPAWTRAFPAGLQTLARSARHAAQAQRLLDELAEDDLRLLGDPPRVAELRRLSAPRQANALRYWLRRGWQVAGSEAQMAELLRQIDACSTRGHRIELRLADGHLRLQDGALQYRPPI